MSRFTHQDKAILSIFGEYHYLQRPQVVRLTGRHEDSIKRRLRALTEMGYLKRLPLPHESATNINAGALVHFLSQKGADYVGLEVRVIDGKTNRNLPHEMLITRFHLAEEPVFWEQRFRVIYDKFGDNSVNPDAFFGVVDPDLPPPNVWYFFLEAEKSKEAKYRRGKSALMRKMETYLEYSKGAFQKRWELPNFRVLTILPTEERVARFIHKMREEGGRYKSRKFVFIAEQNIGEDKYQDPETFPEYHGLVK